MTVPAITVYTTGWCPYCQRVRQLLAVKNLTFTEINVEDDSRFRDEMVARSGRQTVPQVFVGDRHLGGCDELFALDRGGELDRLIQGD